MLFHRLLSVAFLCWWLFVGSSPTPLPAQDIWSGATYPDETGFQRRMAPMLPRIAAKGFGQRSLATSKCPDTGLPVKTWAVKGESIISPYTGRTYVQGETGYFGPKAKNEAGEITAFGGDPLKYDLPPATARFLLDPQDEEVRAFLSIPGNLRQQYHFACANWARFYPMLADQMGAAWKARFQAAVAAYEEARRPSDGNREWNDLSEPHNLVGQEGFLLGGNPLDGGTENHKTMWRTSALLYSQLFPDTAQVSGYPVQEAELLTKDMLRDYLKRLLLTGNGEYDSQVYYPYSIEGFLNLYDFSPDPETRALAKFALDYYFATYGLKVVDGTIAGAQKRGYLPGGQPNKMESLIWGFFDHTSRPMREPDINIHQATTTYRPNKVIWNIVRKRLQPFEARLSHPFYHMDHPHAFAETFYAAETFAMGNVQMTIVDNPNQQMVWSLVAEGSEGPLCFSGGHPMRGSTSGHSPYTQTFQSKGSLIVLTAPTQSREKVDTLIAPEYAASVRPNLWHLPQGQQGKDYELRNRQKYAAAPLEPLPSVDVRDAQSVERFWEEGQGKATTWLYFPRELTAEGYGDYYLFDAHETVVGVRPIGDSSFVVQPSEEVIAQLGRRAKRFFQAYALLVVTGKVSGYVLEAQTQGDQRLADVGKALATGTQLDLSQLMTHGRIRYKNLNDDRMQLAYRPHGLRCAARLNGQAIDWDTYTQGAVYDSPYLKVKDGIMEVSDGQQGYRIDFTGQSPLWQRLR